MVILHIPRRLCGGMIVAVVALAPVLRTCFAPTALNEMWVEKPLNHFKHCFRYLSRPD